MPNASAPNAPCVAVWLSPQTTVMPGCVSPCSGPMTCTMPCLLAVEAVAGNAELLAVRLQLRDLRRGDLIDDRQATRRGRNAVIDGREGQIRPAHFQPALAQARERLRRSDFVHQVQIDVDQRRRARLLARRRGESQIFSMIVRG